MRLPFTGDDGSPQLGNFVKETSTHKNVRSLWKKDCESPSNLLQKTSFRTSSWTTWSSSVGFCLYRRLFLTNSKVLSCITLRRSSTFSFEHCSLEHRRSREHRKNRMTLSSLSWVLCHRSQKVVNDDDLRGRTTRLQIFIQRVLSRVYKQ